MLLDIFLVVVVYLASVLSNCMAFDKHSTNLWVAKTQELLIGLSIYNRKRKIAVGNEIGNSRHEAIGIEGTLL